MHSNITILKMLQITDRGGEGAGLEGGLTFVVKLNVKYFVIFVHLYLHFLVGLPRLA